MEGPTRVIGVRGASRRRRCRQRRVRGRAERRVLLRDRGEVDPCAGPEPGETFV